ncbi:hypothetical protein JKP88DRAFT_206063 [Tribonema minus]|uniref:Uncharacterized protein n=1 Tax=Tribonema minus TaxID=303371 RepID=A0A836CLC1_9STRA|nr:hypothetical protein JKP88DRAFT_206063 [Tribonema minus]
MQNLALRCVTLQSVQTSAAANVKEAEARGTGGQVRYALCFFGLTRSVQWTIQNIERHIFAPLRSNDTIRYDVFVHTYRMEKLDNPRAGEVAAVYANPNSDVQKLRPTRYLITSQDDFDLTYPDVQTMSPLQWSYPDNTTVQNIFRAQNSLALVWSIMADFAAEHSIDYDAVVALRPDVLYLRDLDIPQRGVLPERTAFVADFQHYGGCNDRFAYGRPSAMRVYANRLDSMLNAALRPVGDRKSFNSEQLLQRHLEAHNVSVVLADMLFSRVRSTGALPKQDKRLVVDACKQHLPGACKALRWSEQALGS